jgi:hypothetical protein
MHCVPTNEKYGYLMVSICFPVVLEKTTFLTTIPVAINSGLVDRLRFLISEVVFYVNEPLSNVDTFRAKSTEFPTSRTITMKNRSVNI